MFGFSVVQSKGLSNDIVPMIRNLQCGEDPSQLENRPVETKRCTYDMLRHIAGTLDCTYNYTRNLGP